MSTRPVGIIGSGEFSRLTAERLTAAGQRVLIYTLGDRPEACAGLMEVAPTLTDIGFDCKIVLAFVEDSLVFRDMLIGTPDKTGLGAELSPGSIIVDFGVRPPRETQALLGVTGQRGIALLDAAIVGSDTGSPTAAAAVLLGGYPDSVDKIEPLLSHVARVERTGALGSAHAAAALIGYMEAAHCVARNEAVAVGKALGLSKETLSRVVDTPDTEAPSNIFKLQQRTGLAARLASDNGITADVIDFTGTRLSRGLQSDR